jgi:DNA-binding transcriptional MerR regulator
MYIGEASKKTGLSVKAIRFYEEKGLIPTPKRQGRYRLYSDGDVEILSLICEAKEFGVPLARLKGVIVYRDGEADWGLIREFLRDYKKELEDQILDITYKTKKIENCIISIDSCPKA